MGLFNKRFQKCFKYLLLKLFRIRWYRLKSSLLSNRVSMLLEAWQISTKKKDFELHLGISVKSITIIKLLAKRGLEINFVSLIFLHIGGSLLSLGKEKKGSLRNLAKAVGHKVSTLPGRGKKKNKEESFGAIPESTTGISGSEFTTVTRSSHARHDADPGVISDDEDEFRVIVKKIIL